VSSLNGGGGVVVVVVVVVVVGGEAEMWTTRFNKQTRF
jgi:hypothetical protein